MVLHTLVIHPDNEVKELTLASLQNCQGVLGALLEAVPLAGGVMYVEKERLNASDANIIATRLLQMVGITQPDTWIFGSVMVVGVHDTDISPKLRSLVRLIAVGVKAEQVRVSQVSQESNGSCA